MRSTTMYKDKSKWQKVTRSTSRLLPIAAVLVTSGPALAFDFSLDNGISGNFDNTFKYSTGIRLADQNSYLTSNANTDDGDRNFKQGKPITNRVDWLSEFDAKYGTFGVSVSADAWYDQVYNKSNYNDSPVTNNNISVPYNQFTGATRDLSGRRVELLNAFVSNKFNFGDVPVLVRAGQHTVLWGESLYFPDNGIAYGMAAIDGQKALSVPNTQAKEVFLPVPQISSVAILPHGVSLEGYYQFGWRPLRTPPVGSYFSPADMFGTGGESLITPFGRFLKGPDQTPNTGQFGAAVKWRPEGANVDLGAYALRFNEKTPQIFTTTGGTFIQAYQENIQLYGLSASTTIGPLNTAGEISFRHNQSLAISSTNAPVLAPGQSAQGAGPLGDVFLWELNGIYAGKAGPFYDNISFAGSIAGQQVTSITRNGQYFDETKSRTAVGLRGVVTLDYYQVLPGLDLHVPIGVGWTVLGRSPLPAGFNTYNYGNAAGDFSIGIQGTYAQTWKGGISLTTYFGPASSNAYRDRTFVIATISNTF
ncbi:hypothetical protein CIC12_20385 [Burkholderia sp. SG-MS1]|uniref:DUF1302 domain-containing protein n=1 Tax=Paraburkholderia sp. SG-MS1 TaxID=2023741 RepID=UPI001445DE3E|nr:DUF1302 family protein [Paraburkholderia sp. SG-MS1]NKJ49051.1 hypothetical protein [Paraburkholderia sp. SG-MS1]